MIGGRNRRRAARSLTSELRLAAHDEAGQKCAIASSIHGTMPAAEPTRLFRQKTVHFVAQPHLDAAVSEPADPHVDFAVTDPLQFGREVHKPMVAGISRLAERIARLRVELQPWKRSVIRYRI